MRRQNLAFPLLFLYTRYPSAAVGYILLLNVNTGTVWVYLDTLFTKYSRFKELNMGL